MRRINHHVINDSVGVGSRPESLSLKESLINLTNTRSAKNFKPKETQAETQAEFVLLEETTVDESSSVFPKIDTIKQTTINEENNSKSEIDSEEAMMKIKIKL